MAMNYQCKPLWDWLPARETFADSVDSCEVFVWHGTPAITEWLSCARPPRTCDHCATPTPHLGTLCSAIIESPEICHAKNVAAGACAAKTPCHFSLSARLRFFGKGVNKLFFPSSPFGRSSGAGRENLLLHSMRPSTKFSANCHYLSLRDHATGLSVLSFVPPVSAKN